MSSIWTQEQMFHEHAPIIKATGSIYKKFRSVFVRPALAGEIVATIVSDGKETQVTVKEGEDAFVVKNSTEAEEMYVLTHKQVADRYVLLPERNGWREGLPKGRVLAITWMNPDRSFVAPWGETMPIKRGDFLVIPLFDGTTGKEIYRVAQKEFGETYEFVRRVRPNEF